MSPSIETLRRAVEATRIGMHTSDDIANLSAALDELARLRAERDALRLVPAGSFAERLEQRSPMAIAAARPKYSGPMALCHPHVLTLDGNVVGLVSITMSAQLVAGLESTRILTAIEEALSYRKPDLDELREAAVIIRRHLDSLSAAVDHAEEEHDATHQQDRSAH